MNCQEAKEILELYRPGTSDGEDPEVMEAIDVARQDAELARWFEDHCAMQTALRSKFQEIKIPAHLKDAILAEQKIVRPAAWWRQPGFLAAAACIVISIGIAGAWLRPRTSEHFSNFQARMVSTALREYRMDLVTNDMHQVRQYMASRGAPADYELTKGLERLQLTGGGLLRWRNNPVAMVCFDRGDNQMLFLFVMDRSAVKDPPPVTPQVNKVHDLIAASWTSGNKTYVLAGPEETDFLRKYL